LYTRQFLFFFLIMRVLLTLFVRLKILFLSKNIWILFFKVFLKNTFLLLLLLKSKLILLPLKKSGVS